MFSKPASYYQGETAYRDGLPRTKNPFTWAGIVNRGNETWWFTGFDHAERDEIKPDHIPDTSK